MIIGSCRTNASPSRRSGYTIGSYATAAAVLRGGRRDLVKYSDEFSAGAGKKGGDMPTEGMLFWEETDKAKIKFWALKNRDSLWGMLYGAAKLPPAGGPAL